jgi:hypothetical protein
MDALLELEPREAGLHEVEPRLHFDEVGMSMQDRTRCAGCCQSGTEVIAATQSATTTG